jgi:signal transduction histidine kinase
MLTYDERNNKIIRMSDTRVLKSAGDQGKSISEDANKHIENSETLFCRAIENAGGVPFQLIFGQRPGEGYFTKVGAGIRQLLGIPQEEFTEKLFHSMIEEVVPLSDDIPADLCEAREKFIIGELGSYKAEILLRTPGGEKKWILDSSLPLRDESRGKIVGEFGILFDINESKQIIGSLEKASKQARECDRLKAAFLRNLPHEIRTPLNAIVGFSTLISEQENDPQRQLEFIEIITYNADQLLEIMTDVVEVSDIEAGTVKVSKEEINLNKLLERIWNRFIIKASGKNISLSYVAPAEDDQVNIITDRFKLSQILNNLVGNAVKFTREGKVEFGYSIKGDMIEFYVADTGPGISSEYHERIFSNFYQVDNGSTRRYEGTGLGLPISKAYVKLLGGEIWFASQPGEGSVFYCTVPYEKVARL